MANEQKRHCAHFGYVAIRDVLYESLRGAVHAVGAGRFCASIGQAKEVEGLAEGKAT